MNKLEVIETVSGLAIGIGVKSIITNAVKATTPEETKALDKVCISLGVIAISGLVGTIVIKYADTKIKEVTKWFKGKVEDEEIKNETI